MKQISLRAARVNAGLTLDTVHKLLGISKYTLAKYENGESIPRFDTVVRMCEIYDCPIDAIFIPLQ